MAHSKALLGGAILLYFLIALEILIMVSPFAAFFYAGFSPLLVSLARWPATRWLTAFFLPHMISPPGLILQTIRVLGSVLFVLGFSVFLVCAGQVYFNKLAGRGVALKGPYSLCRHPQYAGLMTAGAGLAILWPRLMVVALWPVMALLYYLLAKDEERRMVRQFGSEYGDYMNRTGMFLPRPIEAILARVPLPRSDLARKTLVFALVAALSIGGAFALRSYSISTLPMWSNGPVTVVPILSNEIGKVARAMPAILEIPEIKSHLESSSKRYLVYFMEPNYIMQGLIADTGKRWGLYRHHRTFSNFLDWVFHPFGHLKGGHTDRLHFKMNTGRAMAGDRFTRRLIFLRVETRADHSTPGNLFAINTPRSPAFFVDVNVDTGELKEIHDLPARTAWWSVPTPTF